MKEDPNRRFYRSTPTVSYDAPMHGQRNIKKCKDRLLHDIEKWANGHFFTKSISQRISINKELTSVVNDSFKSLEK